MSVAKLITQNFRNLEGKAIDFHPALNFIVGANGSGKSSLLEAIFYLGHGKSFRTSKVNNLARHQASGFVVSVRNEQSNQLGLSRDLVSGETDIKINGQRKARLSELAKNIAVQIVTPESFKLFFGGAKERRRFVDLGLFHVEHDFSDKWREFSKVHKQRNACLRKKLDRAMLDYWSELFCKHSLIVSQSRASYIDLLVKELKLWISLLLPKLDCDISIQYSQGWHQKKELTQVLVENREKEVSYGHSLFGAHKFDVKFLISRKPLEIALSRGQQKLFLLALTFAQAKLIEKVKRVKPILLIDDVGAELDLNSRQLLTNAIAELDCQVIVTAIDQIALEPLILDNKNYKMFHVEHGDISVVSEY